MAVSLRVCICVCVWGGGGPPGWYVGCHISYFTCSLMLMLSLMLSLTSFLPLLLPLGECTQPSPLPLLLRLIGQSMNPQMSPCFARHLPDPHLTCTGGRTRAVSSVATQSCSSTMYRGIRLVFTPAPPPMLLGRPLQTSPSLCSVSGRGG